MHTLWNILEYIWHLKAQFLSIFCSHITGSAKKISMTYPRRQRSSIGGSGIYKNRRIYNTTTIFIIPSSTSQTFDGWQLNFLIDFDHYMIELKLLYLLYIILTSMCVYPLGVFCRTIWCDHSHKNAYAMHLQTIFAY